MIQGMQGILPQEVSNIHAMINTPEGILDDVLPSKHR
jgi:hypothetical protein